MGCIETRFCPFLRLKLLLINFNMGCIETKCFAVLHCIVLRLTLTWDVLKPETMGGVKTDYKINFNMGCIET